MELVHEVWGKAEFYRERVTDVMYMRSITSGNFTRGETYTLMMDPHTNGPLTYANWLKYKAEAEAETKE